MAITVQMQFESAVTELYEDAFIGSSIEHGTTIIQFDLRKHDFQQELGTQATLCWRKESEDVSNLLILCQIARPNSCRLMKSPITRSCICFVLEKQIVRRTNRLIRVRKLMCLLSIFCVFSFPTLWFSASR